MAPPPHGTGHAGYDGGACGIPGARAATAGRSDSRGGGDRGAGGGGGGIADDNGGKKEIVRLASAAAAAAPDPHGRGFWEDSAVAEVYRALQQRNQRQGVSVCLFCFSTRRVGSPPLESPKKKGEKKTKTKNILWSLTSQKKK